MKKLFIALMALTMLSCTTDDTYIINESTECCPTNSHWEIITCDTEDNIIKINGVWLQNSNFDWSNWQYLQTRGWKTDNDQLTIVTTDGSKILQAELMGIDPTWLYVTRPNDHTVVFYSTNENIMNSGDVYYVNLKIANH